MKTQTKIPRGVLIAAPIVLLAAAMAWLGIQMVSGEVQTWHVVVGLVGILVGLVGVMWVFLKVLPGLRSGPSVVAAGDVGESLQLGSGGIVGVPGGIVQGSASLNTSGPVGQPAPVGRWLLPPIANQPLPPLQRLERDGLLRRLQALTRGSSVHE